MPKFENKEEYERWKSEKINKTQADSHDKTPEKTTGDPLPQKPEQTSKDSQLRFSKKDLSEFVINFFNENYPGTKKRYVQNLFYGKFIPDQKLKNARRSFYIDNEKVLLLFEGAQGDFILLTDSYFYYATKDEKGMIPLEEIDVIKTGTKNAFDFPITLNEKRIHFRYSVVVTKGLDVLEMFFIKMNLDILKVDIDKPTELQNEIFNKIHIDLIENENIIYVCWDVIDHFFDERDGNHFIVCTSHRLIICTADLNGLKRRVDYPYDHISSIEIKKAPEEILSLLKVCELRIAAVQSVMELNVFKCADMERIRDIVTKQKQKSNTSDKESQNSDLHNITISQEIIKLKNLLESGALTQEEFSEAKKKLLDRL